jgi:hypothetical protein
MSRPAVDGPFAVINADDFYGRSAFQSVAGFLNATAGEATVPHYCMVGYRVGNTLTEHGTVARAQCEVDSEGFLTHAVERTRIRRAGNMAEYTEDGEHWIPMSLDTTVSMNFWGLTPAVFDDLANEFSRFLRENRENLEKVEFYIPNFIADLIRSGRARVKVLPTNERWHGVTYAEDKPQVRAALQAMVEAGVYPAKLWG